MKEVSGEPVEQAEAVEGENVNWANQVEETEAKEGEESKENVPKLLTLDEYKALKSAVMSQNDFKVRKAGEGEDLNKWGKTYVLKKKEDEEEEEEEEEQEEVEEEEEDEEKKKLADEIQKKFFSKPRERRERPPRGERPATGGAPAAEGEQRPRGPPKGERRPPKESTTPSKRKETRVPKIDDDKDFPSLK